jgi:hypothetical protein
MSAENEVELFGSVLDELGPNEMVNQAIEITLSGAGVGYELYDTIFPSLTARGFDSHPISTALQAALS